MKYTEPNDEESSVRFSSVSGDIRTIRLSLLSGGDSVSAMSFPSGDQAKRLP